MTKIEKNILIIDNKPDNLQVLFSRLHCHGYQVREAINWQAAITICQTRLPDLILLDIMIPDIDGYEICQRLKEWRLTSEIPIIFMSVLDGVFDKVKAFNSGCVDYITKPFAFEEVLARIQNHLELKQAKMEILQLNYELEGRVKKRTQDLENALQELKKSTNARNVLQNKLLDIVLHDSLTGLANRVLFIKKLENALNQARKESSYKFAVLFLDCDRFKVVNDSLGHLVGDELLVAIARRLQSCLSPFDTLSRLGGDEFGILLENITGINSAILIAKALLRKLSVAFKLSRYEVFMTASIGINWGSTDYEKPEYLLRDADTAMNRAKSLGKARYHVFDPVMYQEAIQLLQLENDLRKAVERQEFLVYYQPIISLSTGKIISLEALVRWQHPTRDLVFPIEFIPASEEIGLINEINIWVLQEACETISSWSEKKLIDKSLSISVNLSVRLFYQTNLIAHINRIINQTKISSCNLKIEITESVIMENHRDIKNVLSHFQKLNIPLIMDDFGTGYSSLSYLHSFPFNALKIDKSFVRRMQDNQENMGLVPAMISIAHSMGMTAIAEGVETPEQLAQLRCLNCDYAQGYLFSQPLPKELMIDLLLTSPQW
ncbi:Two-component system response regulator [Richelia intracellularis HH01]|uniref:Two-component system response regulator n=2 Tax=Richelia TaxID=98443 RepID=M1X319_9NOST|nr:EAL domain-containing protein [Richelia intracellularis]CCH67805.1 Two-component system response regulator [Richelia intracellularis HH01]HAE05290.1 GGDEF domain-containing response regulator [Richelia sp.]